MPSFKKETLKSLKIIFLAIVLSFGISAISLYKTDITEAKLDPPVISFSGHAWAENIGWVSLNCMSNDSCATSNYKVVMDQDGNLSGYAWSENIGWLSFNPSDVSDCPDGVSCSPILNRWFGAGQGEVNGWIKALSGGTVGSGGWDGFIKLSGDWANGVKAGAYPSGVNGIGTGLSGFAWGSDVIGWIDFRGEIAGGVIADSLLVCRSDWRKNCSTAPNSCGLRNFGFVQCDGSCSIDIPPAESACSTLNAPVGPGAGGGAGVTGGGDGAQSCPFLDLTPQTVPPGGTTNISWNGQCTPSPSCVLYESPSGIIISTSTVTVNNPAGNNGFQSNAVNGRLTLILECSGLGVGTTSVSKTIFSKFDFKEI